MKKLFLLSILLILGFSLVNAQVKVSGKVLDTHDEPLIGASILLVGSVSGTVTDIDGSFSLLIPEKKGHLKISYTGFRPKTIELKEKSLDSLIIRLEEDAAKLEEVAVIAYAPAKERKDLKTRTSGGYPIDIAMDAAPVEKKIRESSSSDSDMSFAIASETYEEVVYDASSASTSNAAAGMLTAGSLNDFQKWELWNDISSEDLAEWKDIWTIYPKERYSVQLTNKEGFAIINATIQLLDDKKQIIWESRTDNTGKAELWANIDEELKQTATAINIIHAGQSYAISDIKTFQEGINILQLPTACLVPTAIDIAFVVDATGSMSDEISYLKAELKDVISRVKDSLPQMDLNLGSIFYRDLTDAYLVRQSPLSANIDQTINFIQKQGADGGGDTPEAVESALDTAINQLSWSENAVAKLVFLVLDAPPHQTPKVTAKMKELMQLAAKKGIRIIPIACSGTDKSTEYLMRSLALGTNGNYLFLTDDSGIGNPHIEPTTDEYEVQKFNDLLLETILQMSSTRSCDDPIQIEEFPNDTLVVSTPQPTDKEPSDEPQISWKYFPNPTLGLVNIELEGQVGALYLSDFTGKILERIEVNNTQNLQIDISQYPAGTYYLKYHDGEDNWLSGKVILVHS